MTTNLLMLQDCRPLCDTPLPDRRMQQDFSTSGLFKTAYRSTSLPYCCGKCAVQYKTCHLDGSSPG